VSAFRLACLAYFCAALPSSILGLLWPSIRVSLRQPVAALGVLVVFGVAASAVASVAAGRLLARWNAGALLAVGTLLTGVALAVESVASSVVVFGGGMMLFGLGFGTVNAALNAYAAARFGARQINGIHAAYGLGATAGPALATALLGGGMSWRWVYGSMGAMQALLAVAFALTVPAWAAPRPRPAGRTRKPAVAGSLVFTAVEAGIEAAAGIWGYVFLTEGRGIGATVAGLVVSAYWGMTFFGRLLFGTLAERLGVRRVLGAAVLGVSAGAALMIVPSPLAAAVGLVVLGLAAAPVFPLFTLTTAERVGAGADQAVGLQVAASEVGSAVLPAGIGLAIGASTGTALAPPLLALSLTMCVIYRAVSR
jgi:fucose permease